jgi:hypothetical protein
MSVCAANLIKLSPLMADAFADFLSPSAAIEQRQQTNVRIFFI